MTTPDPAMTTARDIIDLAAQAMYTQDAQDSMASADWDNLSEDERDDWRRIADAGIAALRDAGLLPPDGGRTLRDDIEAVDRG